MKPAKPPPLQADNKEISALIDTLHSTGRRLEELTAGEVDGVADEDGQTFLLRHVQERVRDNDAARQSSILNALPANIALLDSQGRIVSVNQGWQSFADANGLQCSGFGVGANYLDACDGTQGDDTATAQRAARGIRALLNGATDHFSMEYPCHSPTRQRWFLMTASPLTDERPTGVVVMHLDITERKQAEQESRESERISMESRADAAAVRDIAARLQAILDTVADGVTTIDKDGEVETFNPAAERIFGYAADEVVGHNIRMLMPEPDRSKEDGHLARYRSTGEARIVGIGREVMGRRKDGSTVPLDLSVSEMTLGGERHFTGVVRDITERKAVERELVTARVEAERANAAKNTFLANMSHEIRTPMNGIVGMAQLLGLTPLNQAQQQYLEAIEVSADNLLDLISDILDLSKVEAGKVELEFGKYSLRKAVQDVVMTQRSRMQQKGLQLQLELPDDLPQLVWGDQLRLKQILLNLLGNAVKFTEQGGITLTAAVLERQAWNALIRITVADTGIGIDPAMLGTIFQAFCQADSSITRRFGGSGLGLNICSKLAELMGGSITVESEPGQGSRFHLVLPFDIAQPAEATDPLSEAVSALPVVPPLTVLVAEDNEVNSHTAEQMLQILGHRPQICRDGRAAVDCWARGGVDLILMDIQMPVMGGEEALQLIRSAEAGQGYRTPVVALTADALYGTRERLLAAGFDGYLAKPFRLATLTAELQQAMMAGDGDRQP